MDGGSYDPDGPDDIDEITINNSILYGLGEHPVSLTILDQSGESDTCTATVTVVDITPPIPDLPILPTLTGACSVTITSKPSAFDSCAGIINGTTTDPLEYSEQGTYTVTWTYADNNGN